MGMRMRLLGVGMEELLSREMQVELKELVGQ